VRRYEDHIALTTNAPERKSTPAVNGEADRGCVRQAAGRATGLGLLFVLGAQNLYPAHKAQ